MHQNSGEQAIGSEVKGEKASVHFRARTEHYDITGILLVGDYESLFFEIYLPYAFHLTIYFFIFYFA